MTLLPNQKNLTKNMTKNLTMMDLKMKTKSLGPIAHAVARVRDVVLRNARSLAMLRNPVTRNATKARKR